ncbi:hypothetical protein T439DRAFT_358017 [Meredithblackwellia eburnea MCA 4105]
MCDDHDGCSHGHSAAELHKEAFKEVFGEHSEAFEALKKETDRIRFESWKAEQAALKPFQEALGPLSQKVPKFWLNSMLNHRGFRNNIPPIDHEAFEALEDVQIVRANPDEVRDFDVVLTFSENKFFSNRELKLHFTVTPPADSEDIAPEPFDLAVDYYFKETTTPILWKSDEVNLVLKAPKVDIDSAVDADGVVEVDEEKDLGSFFHTWSQVGEDDEMVGESFVTWRDNALEYALGPVPDSDDEWEDSDDDDDDDDDEKKKDGDKMEE